ncbi:MAG: hypothetical protein ABJA82_17360 [Myxococcales bacterium]
MGQPVVLPKFELQEDRPHWAIRAAWITGGLLLVSVLGLAAVIVHHRNLETQAQIARVEAIARVKAEADAKVAAIAAAAKAQKEAELAAKVAARSIPATTVPGAATAGSGSSGDKAKAATGSTARRGHSSHSAKAFKSKSGPGGLAGFKSDKKPAASNKPDAIDELLRKMK